MNLKSDILKEKIETTPHRSLLRASWLKDEDFEKDKPFIWIANSYNNIVPWHIHLNKLTEQVMKWIRDSWWVPFVWWVPAVCDWIAMYAEMRLSLPSRDHIADNVEIMMLSHSFDWWVWVTNCDKITPWMLMAAWRLNLPCVILTWWPMEPWKTSKWENEDLITVFESVWAYKAWKLNKEDLKKAECSSCPTAWSCAWLFTANSMACVTECLWMSLTDCACTLATDPKKLDQAYQSWIKIVELVKKWIKARDIMNRNAFFDAMTLDNAIWWSTNVTLHLPAIAKECWIDISLKDFDNISKVTPNICHIRPAWPFVMADIHKAWWIKMVMKVLESKMNLNRISVNGILSDVINLLNYDFEKNNKFYNVIRPLSDPYYEEWWVACLIWNFCSESVVKQTSVDKEMLIHSWPAKVYYSEQELIDWISWWEIQEWDIIVLPFQWPAWAPWMPEMLSPTAAIKWAWFKRVALITDWRFSWGTAWPCIWHIYPEAYNWWRIWLIKNKDIIEIDMKKRIMNVKVNEDEFEKRKSQGIKNLIPNRPMTPMLEKFRRNYAEIDFFNK